MRATAFEFRYRFAVILMVFAVGFLLTFLDHRIAGVELAGWLGHPTPGGVRAVLGAGAGLVALGALIRTWATAYLSSDVVHDANVRAERLVADGPYRFVRNPLYLGLELLALGTATMTSRLGAVWIVVALTLVMLRLIGREEAELAARLGPRFAAYRAAVPRLVPSLGPRWERSGARPSWAHAIAGETLIWALAVGAGASAATRDLRWYGGLALLGVVLDMLARRLIREHDAPGAGPLGVPRA